ncbi:MAG: ABC transporter substrate-binding protein [Sphaerochaetaceae bacterium]
MKRSSILLLILLVAATLVFAGANKEAATKEREVKERITIVDATVLTKLDTQNNNTLVCGYFYQLTHSTLIDCDYDTNEYIPELATKWEISDDGLRYLFHLRNDVSFHDGTPFTAYDVKYTFDRAYKTPSQYPKLMFMKECNVIDDYTVQFVLNSTDAEFLDNLCSPNLSIICKASGAGKDDWGYQNGTGPFKLAEWLPGSYALLVRNDLFWGEHPKTKEIYYQLISESSARTIALETGDADICVNVSPVEAGNIENYGCSLVKMPSQKLTYIALNNSGYVEAFKDIRVRKAFHYATDQIQLITLMREGYGNAINGVIPAPVKFSAESSMKGYEYNPEKARQLLAEAGYPDGITVSLWYNDATLPGLYEALQAMWAKAGIMLALGTNDSAILATHIKAKDYDITVASWTFSTIGYSMNSLWQSRSGSNKTLTADENIDRLLVAGASELNESKRAAIYEELDKYILYDCAAMIPMYSEILLSGVREGVEGCRFYPNGRLDFTYATAAK